jgi:hypothetical protein
MNSLPPIPRAWRIPGLFVFLALALATGGCNGPAPKYLPELYMESPSDTGIPVEMPLSHVTYYRMKDPFMTAEKFQNVSLVKYDLGNALLFTFSSDFGRDALYTATAHFKGKKIFLLLSGKPMGAFYIDPNSQPIDSAMLAIWPEVPEKDLLPDPKTNEPGPFMKDLQDSIAAIQKRVNDSK